MPGNDQRGTVLPSEEERADAFFFALNYAHRLARQASWLALQSIPNQHIRNAFEDFVTANQFQGHTLQMVRGTYVSSYSYHQAKYSRDREAESDASTGSVSRQA